MLQRLPAYRNATVVRSRDPARLAACDIVVDVGGEFDAKRLVRSNSVGFATHCIARKNVGLSEGDIAAHTRPRTRACAVAL